MSYVGTNILHHLSKKEDKAIKKEQVIISGKSSLDVLNLSTNGTNKAILEPSIDFPLSDDECFIDLCDKEELCDSAENKKLLPTATKKDELKLLFYLNTLGYIEFDTLCALNN